MGNLTVLAIRHDALDAIRDNPEQFVTELVNTIQSMPRKSTDVRCGNHGNVATAMPYRHASDSAAYILAGNTIEEINYDTAQPGHWAAKHIETALTRAGIRFKP
jgi:hypothetical protein